jgi:tetratricopeptide (TPR) repeat protein
MRTLRKDVTSALIALTLLAYLPSAYLPAEERDSNLRRQALSLNEVTGKDPLLGEEEMLLQDKSAAKKMIAEAARMAQEKPQPFNYNATLILGSVAANVKNYKAAETFFRLHLEQAKQLRSTQGILAAYRGLIPVVYNTKRYTEAENLCKEVRESELLVDTLRNLEFEKDKDADQERKSINRFLIKIIEEEIVSVAQQGEANRAIDLIDHFFKNQSKGWAGLDLKGRVYRICGKNKEALKIYDEEMKLIKDDKDLKKEDREELLDDIRYSLSGVYAELGQIDKAAEQLKALLAKDPDNPTYNNDLGYIWADHDMNLAESEKLVRKAIEDDRKLRQKANPGKKPDEIKERGAYLDSLGWVLYKQKKYEQAKKYLQQAVQYALDEDEDESIEILDHYGDVLMALGQKTEAVNAWKKLKDHE